MVSMVPWEATLVAGIAGGVIGVGGTYLGAWLTGRTQTANLKLSIITENERARIAEKRRIYARFLMACAEVVKTQIHGTTQPEEAPGTAKLAAASDYSTAIAAVMASAAEVELIASDEVGKLAEDLRVVLPAYKPSAQRNPGDYEDMLRQLLKAMRADLGEPV
jgi:hypothetical protein